MGLSLNLAAAREVAVSGTCNLTVEQGATWSVTVTWEVDGSPVNLTNYSARMQVRTRHEASATLVSLTSAVGGGLTLGGVAGTIGIALSATATAALPAGGHVYDLEMVSGAGVVTRLLEGRFTVTPEVTR